MWSLPHGSGLREHAAKSFECVLARIPGQLVRASRRAGQLILDDELADPWAQHGQKALRPFLGAQKYATFRPLGLERAHKAISLHTFGVQVKPRVLMRINSRPALHQPQARLKEPPYAPFKGAIQHHACTMYLDPLEGCLKRLGLHKQFIGPS